jgi:hypothetical protein
MKINRTITGWLTLAMLPTMTRFKMKMPQFFLLLFVAGVAVAARQPTAPHFTSISVSGTTLTLKAVNGLSGGQFVLLGTTNVALPLSQWTPLLTNKFDSNGSLNLSTNIINPTAQQQFYMLKQ